MGGGGIIIAYFAGLALVWLASSAAMRSEPTTHGQDVLFLMGCIGGLFWPVFVAYFIVASPLIAWTMWRERAER